MPRFFVKNEQVKESTIIIIGEDIKHIKNVLRKQIGDNIEICDKDSKKSYICEIEKIGDKNILTKIIKEVIEENPTQLESYKKNPKLFDYFVGQVMKKTRGKANPALSAKILKQELDK